MNKYIISIISIFLPSILWAQIDTDLTTQSQLETKQQTEQLAAVGIYTQLIKDGYGSSSSFLAYIAENAESEYNSHQKYVESGRNSILQQLIHKGEYSSYFFTVRDKINSVINAVLLASLELGVYDSKEQAYISKVCNRLLEDSYKFTAQFIVATESAEVAMSDSRRFLHIQKLEIQMQKCLQFSTNFHQYIHALARVKIEAKNPRYAGLMAFK